MTLDLDFLKEPALFDTFSAFEEQCRSRPQDLALVFGSRRQTYGELLDCVERLTGALMKRGHGSRSRVLLLVTNSPEMIWLQLALLKLGCTFAPCEIRSSESSLADIAADLDPTLVVYHNSVGDKVRELIGEGRREAIAVRSADEEHQASLGDHPLLRELLEEEKDPRMPPAEDAARARVCYYRVDREDAWRGALFSLAALAESAQAMVKLFTLRRHSVVLAQMSLSHSISLASQLLPALFSGGTLVLLDRSDDDEDVRRAIDEWSPRLMINTRKYFWYLHRSLQRSAAEGRPLQGSVMHSLLLMDGVRVDFREEWQKSVGGHLLEGYAPHVAASFIAMNLPWLQIREDTVGKPLPGFELSIRDDGQHERPAGKWGEIHLQGPRVCEGWTGEQEENPEAPVEDWQPSGQMAMLDTEGFLHLADEVFDVIWVFGFKVSPLEVEQPLLALPGIRDVAAVNAPRYRQPDRIQVFVHQSDGSQERWTAESLLQACEELFPPYLRPSIVTFVDHIPYDDEERKLRKELKYKYRNTEQWRSH